MATTADASSDVETEAQSVSTGDHGETGAPLPVRTILLGSVGSVLILLGALGAGGILLHDPILGNGPLSWIRYGHGQMLATMVVYLGFGLVVWSWVRLGRHVLAGRVGTRPVVLAAACWTAPLLIAPALFTRDVYLYIAYGTLPLHGQDPYTVGPGVLEIQPIVENVDAFWQTTPAPYGPLFILLAKGVVWITGTNMIAGVILMRLALTLGIVPLLWALPGLVRHLGGKLPVAVWLAVAGPMTVVHLIGGPHNDVLMIGLLAAGTVLVLDRRHVLGIALVTLGVAVKATAVVALPFLVWVWAGHLSSTRWRNFARAVTASVTIFLVTFAAATLVSGVDLGWITALDAPGAIVNWMSLPTAVGEFLHTLAGIFFSDLNKTYFVTVTRILGGLVLLVIVARQWWAARDGGPDAVRRAAIALFAVAILSPATLPWYLTWGFVLAAGLRWSRRQLAALVALAVFLVLTYSPAGRDLLYNWLFMAGAVGISVLAAVSLLRPDPLKLFSSNRESDDPHPADR
ncbi:MAG TPA: polyprenol phosphomannose-dependent alpha 1,6 mannosyltransferase MptB [Actinophytocola sp.]|uniref:polyprenol phosphomannose-dependent alpha 1,6 mannosyltransferase MptB n=1 Tax=Actinophytocola sp. TaxID=1872138 RepID=UPI002DDD5226|nr:polyprenol phosphomannose-dependent alpha 1,6 mannosyltransferase MptB [Actinophytocola sp.]HEV2780243.1 polyprenol phosphomannose-dependent alpha 1,6 mannosyltransferase MptB [Actinophytocola sp.]